MAGFLILLSVSLVMPKKEAIRCCGKRWINCGASTCSHYCEGLNTVKPVRDTLDVINGKWKLPIIISVGVGNNRFTDIQESIPGLTPKVLAKELKNLEQHKLIKRVIIEDYPVKISYHLEPYADTLTPLIYAMKDWGINHRQKIFHELKPISLQEEM